MDSQSEQEMSQVIEESLAAILSGESTLEVVLARYPEYGQELRAELEVATFLVSRRGDVSSRAGFVPASRKRLVGRIKAEAQASSRSGKRASLGIVWPRRFVLQFASAMTIFMLLFLSSFGTVAASQGSVPGDDLYSIKRLSEDVQYTLTLNAASRAQLSLYYSGRRLSEVEVLLVRGQYQDVASTLKDFEYKVNQSVALLQEGGATYGSSSDALAENIQGQLILQTEQLDHLLEIAPQSAQDGLFEALSVSQHGWQTAGEMISKEHPTNTPQLTHTLPATSTMGPVITEEPIVTQATANQGKPPVKTEITPSGPKEPNPGSQITKTPHPTVVKKPTNTDKPLPETKPVNATEEEGSSNNNGSPPESPPGQDKPPKDEGSNNNGSPPDTPPGQDKPTEEEPSNNGKKP